jgi:uridine kinase
MKPRLLGIAGASGSGKSTLASAIQLHPETPSACVLSMDHYYHSLPDHLSPETYNFDHPDALDIEQLKQDILQLREGLEVHIPQYDFTTHRRLEKRALFPPRPLIIVEGILLYVSEAVRNLFDCRIYLNVPLETCLHRRISRDVACRGRTEESVRHQFEAQVAPMYHQFVEPTENSAHLHLDPPRLEPAAYEGHVTELWKEIAPLLFRQQR